MCVRGFTWGVPKNCNNCNKLYILYYQYVQFVFGCYSSKNCNKGFEFPMLQFLAVLKL